jgi:hypothetical protein
MPSNSFVIIPIGGPFSLRSSTGWSVSAHSNSILILSPLNRRGALGGAFTTRIAQPMVRESWLARGPGRCEGRGHERSVPVSWERALDLGAGELDRVNPRISSRCRSMTLTANSNTCRKCLGCLRVTAVLSYFLNCSALVVDMVKRLPNVLLSTLQLSNVFPLHHGPLLRDRTRSMRLALQP